MFRNTAKYIHVLPNPGTFQTLKIHILNNWGTLPSQSNQPYSEHEVVTCNVSKQRVAKIYVRDDQPIQVAIFFDNPMLVNGAVRRGFFSTPSVFKMYKLHKTNATLLHDSSDIGFGCRYSLE